MSEAAKNLPPIGVNEQYQDPNLMVGEAIGARELQIKYQTFAEAQAAPKGISDKFIDDYLDGELTVGSERQDFLKGYLDKVPMTEHDREVVSDPEKVAALYLATADVLARNLKIRVAPGADTSKRDATVQQVKDAKASFLENLKDDATQAADQIAELIENGTGDFPRRTVEFHGLKVDGHDLLNMDDKGDKDVRANIRVQRQGVASFIMGYTDSRVVEKQDGNAKELGKRIYLNPGLEAAAPTFEKVLQTANEAGISLQVKLFQRSQECIMASRDPSRDSLRGDGIVIYASDEDSDEVLAMVLAIAQDSPDDFMGRETSRIPMRVADGIAVGDEPKARGESLTSHRAELLGNAADMTKKSSASTPEGKRKAFRHYTSKIAELNGIDPNNIAFNAEAA